jgi:hypothetical protein
MASNDQEEYSEDALPVFTPMPWYVEKGLEIIMVISEPLCRTIEEVRVAIPDELFIRNTVRGVMYLARDSFLAVAAWSLASLIDPYFGRTSTEELFTPIGAEFARLLAWSA